MWKDTTLSTMENDSCNLIFSSDSYLSPASVTLLFFLSPQYTKHIPVKSLSSPLGMLLPPQTSAQLELFPHFSGRSNATFSGRPSLCLVYIMPCLMTPPCRHCITVSCITVSLLTRCLPLPWTEQTPGERMCLSHHHCGIVRPGDCGMIQCPGELRVGEMDQELSLNRNGYIVLFLENLETLNSFEGKI